MKQELRLFFRSGLLVIIEHTVEVVRLGIFSKRLVKLDGAVLAQVYAKIGHASINQFNTGQVLDVGFYHHGLHATYFPIDLHHLSYFSAKLFDEILVQINPMLLFVLITTFAESAQGLVGRYSSDPWYR